MEAEVRNQGGPRVTLGRAAGSHWATITETGDLVIEWYHFGDDADYEFAKQLIFSPPNLSALCEKLAVSKADVLQSLGYRFSSIWEVEAFLKANSLTYEKKTDFWP